MIRKMQNFCSEMKLFAKFSSTSMQLTNFVLAKYFSNWFVKLYTASVQNGFLSKLVQLLKYSQLTWASENSYNLIAI